MTVHIQRADIARISMVDEVRAAARAGVDLVALWPLDDASQMSNDAKYAENLQVRVTRTIAAVLTHEDVTAADAEFVYEGADSIPGRPQTVVDALIAANNAYDHMADYSVNGDTSLVMGAAGELGVRWDGGTVTEMSELLLAVEQLAGSADGSAAAITSDVEEVAQRLALVLIAGRSCLDIISRHAPEGDLIADAAPMLLYANELCERVSIPRMSLTPDQLAHVAESGRGETGVQTRLESFAAALAPLAAQEWKHHLDDVLWNPDEAKKKAKEDDERKNKEALAAKFAHVPQDRDKPTVEL